MDPQKPTTLIQPAKTHENALVNAAVVALSQKDRAMLERKNPSLFESYFRGTDGVNGGGGEEVDNCENEHEDLRVFSTDAALKAKNFVNNFS